MRIEERSCRVLEGREKLGLSLIGSVEAGLAFRFTNRRSAGNSAENDTARRIKSTPEEFWCLMHSNSGFYLLEYPIWALLHPLD